MQLELKNVSYTYHPEAEQPVYAVDDVSFSIEKGEFIALIGHTGSGKSTLIQFLDGLLKPTAGQVFFHGDEVTAKGYRFETLRQAVGLVFQYPEYQLFESTVIKDVEYGPKNLKLEKEERRKRAEKALQTVGFPLERAEVSPFDLSGGEKRRVAIAGVLAMEPECLVLDEPTAGLDPQGRHDVLEMCRALNEKGITIVLVSHSMEDVAAYAHRVLVMDRGKLILDGPTREVFSKSETLESIGLSAPETVYLMRDLKALGYDVPDVCLTEQEAKEILLRLFGKRK